MSAVDAATGHPLLEVIDRYNDAWNAHDVEAIMRLHAPDMVFENHTAGERAEGEAVREHVAGIFAAWPDLTFRTRRLYVREDLVVQEWTASATHVKPLRRGEKQSRVKRAGNQRGCEQQTHATSKTGTAKRR